MIGSPFELVAEVLATARDDTLDTRREDDCWFGTCCDMSACVGIVTSACARSGRIDRVKQAHGQINWLPQPERVSRT